MRPHSPLRTEVCGKIDKQLLTDYVKHYVVPVKRNFFFKNPDRQRHRGKQRERERERESDR